LFFVRLRVLRAFVVPAGRPEGLHYVLVLQVVWIAFVYFVPMPQHFARFVESALRPLRSPRFVVTVQAGLKACTAC
jgi:hypothetical protein